MQAVGSLDPDAAVPLAEQLLRDADADVACAALTAVAEVENPRVDDLLELAIRSPHIPLRRCAVEAMAGRRTSNAVEMLAWSARLTDAPGVPAAALDALSSIAADTSEVGRAAVDVLVNIGVDEGRRTEAIDALARAGCAAIDAIADSLTEPNAAARLTAVEALARMRHPRASAALTSALNDADPTIRAAAVAGFGRLGTPSASTAIAALRDGDPDPSVRRKAAIVCRRYGWDQ
jgi:HEAT repeat protein